MRSRAGLVLALGLVACTGDGTPTAIDGGVAVDGADPDGADPDGAGPDDAGPDGAAGPVDGTRAVYRAVVASASGQTWGALTDAARVAQGGQVAVATSLSGVLGAISFAVTPYARTGAGTSVSRPVEYVGLRGDQAAVVLAPVYYNPSGPPGPRKLHVIDLATAAVTSTVTAATLGNGGLTDAVRDGAGFVVGERAWAARLSSAGAVGQSFAFTDFTLIAFTRAAPIQALGRDGAGAIVVEDLATGTRSTPALPAGLAGPSLIAPDEGGPLWVRGTLGGVPAVAPLGSTVATALPAGDYVMTTDAAGRVIAVAVVAGRSLRALRIDAARFDGVDGATRLDPTYGGDGQAELALCLAVCSGAAVPALTRLAAASDGSLALFEAEPGTQVALWWFDAP